MIKAARLNIYSTFGEWPAEGPGVVVHDGLETAGLEFEDIEIKGHTHWGNWVLTPIRYEYAHRLVEAIAANGGKARVDMERYILEEEDINGLKVGDRVTLELMGIFAGAYREKGTVVYFENENWPEPNCRYVFIRKYHSQTKGWRLKAGDEAGIWLGW